MDHVRKRRKKNNSSADENFEKNSRIHFLNKLIIIQVIKKFQTDQNPKVYSSYIIMIQLRPCEILYFSRDEKKNIFSGMKCDVIIQAIQHVSMLFHKQPDFPIYIYI